MQNVVRLHKSCSDATFQELLSLISSNGHSIEEVRHSCSNHLCLFGWVLLTYFSFLLNYNEKVLSMVSQLLASEATKASSVLDDLQSSLSTQQGELTLFARELRYVCASGFPSFYL